MDKFATLQRNIFSIFGSVDWEAENIKVYPRNTTANDGLAEFVRLSILPNGNSLNENSISGLIIAEIFSPAGDGPSRATTIADKLDKHLSKRSVTDNAKTITQMLYSSLVDNGADKDNPSLVKSTFSLPFLHFGAQ